MRLIFEVMWYVITDHSVEFRVLYGGLSLNTIAYIMVLLDLKLFIKHIS
jgi:hypothetical protein